MTMVHQTLQTDGQTDSRTEHYDGFTALHSAVGKIQQKIFIDVRSQKFY